MRYKFLKDVEQLKSIRAMMDAKVKFKDISEHFDVPENRRASFYLSVRKSLRAQGLWTDRPNRSSKT